MKDKFSNLSTDYKCCLRTTLLQNYRKLGINIDINVFRVSIEISIAILIVLFIRLIAYHKLPKRLFVAFGVVITLRLIFFANIQLKLPYAISTDIEINNLYSFALVTPRLSHEFIIGCIIIWAAVAVMLFSLCVLRHLLSRVRFLYSKKILNPYIAQWGEQHRCLRHVSILKSKHTKTPLTFGVVAPVIILPEDVEQLEAMQINYILTHEYMHIKRFDILIEWLLLLGVCIHWFNPFVWLLKRYLERDLEAACDEAVITALGEGHKANYARTLLEMQCRVEQPRIVAVYWGRLSIEERITSIMQKRKRNISTNVISATVFAVIALFVFIKAGNDLSIYQSVEQQMVISEDKPIAEFVTSFGEHDIYTTLPFDENRNRIVGITLPEAMKQGTDDYLKKRLFGYVGTIITQTANNSEKNGELLL